LERINAGAVKTRPHATDILIGNFVEIEQKPHLVADLIQTTRASAPKYLVIAEDGSHKQVAMIHCKALASTTKESTAARAHPL
jgi:hypothetical protein